MHSRIDLQTKLEEILGSRNVYFQPPASIQMKYPAIVYQRRDFRVFHANGNAYVTIPGYELILIDKSPDSIFVEPLLQLPYCSYDRHYEADNLNHDVFVIHHH